MGEYGRVLHGIPVGWFNSSEVDNTRPVALTSSRQTEGKPSHH
jgi:hypothetical protein